MTDKFNFSYIFLKWLILIGLNNNLIVNEVQAQILTSSQLPIFNATQLKIPEPPSPQKETLETAPTKEINQLTSQELSDDTFIVTHFEFVGNKALSDAELTKVISCREQSEKQLPETPICFTNRPITFAELLQAASTISQYYIENGYITSGAYIIGGEEQKLTNRVGVVKIQVVEGTLEEINVNIKTGRLNPDYVSSRIAIAVQPALNINRLEEALGLLTQNPLIENLKAELSAGTTPGQNILNIEVEEAETFGLIVSLDNNRNPSVGSFRRSVEISESNLLGFGDRANLTYRNTDGSNEFQISYTLPINPYNSTIDISYKNIDSEIIESPFDRLDIDSTTRYFDLTFRHPVIQTARETNQELALGLTFSRWESDSSVLDVPFPLSLGADAQGRTRITALRFFQEWTQRSIQDIVVARSQFNFGFDAFDATINEDEPDSQFFSWRGQFLWLHLFGSQVTQPESLPTLLIRSDLQLTTDFLVPLEQFSLGGQATVRGYRQDLLLSDNGVLFSAELKFPLINVPELNGRLQVIPFLDIGTVWNTNRENPEPNILAGTGVGLQWEMADSFTARLDWGIPLTNVDSRDTTWQENGLYFFLEYNKSF